MYKLLIADDEPLICAGLQAMLSWEDYNIEIVGTASDGLIAQQMIETHKPDIVIADIKMPRMTGLELAEATAKKHGPIPVFIILTSYSDFDYMRSAIHLQVVDYLAKIKLTPEELATSITKAITLISSHKEGPQPKAPYQQSHRELTDKFFIRLCNGLFESKEDFSRQAKELSLDFSSPYYLVAVCQNQPKDNTSHDDFNEINKHTQNILKETLSKQYHCHCTVHDSNELSVVFFLEEYSKDIQQQIQKVFASAITYIYNYFSTYLTVGVGHVVDNPFQINSSYFYAKRTLKNTTVDRPLLFFRTVSMAASRDTVLEQSRDALEQALELLNAQRFYDVLTEVIEHSREQPQLRIPLTDFATNALYTVFHTLDNGEELVEAAFSTSVGGYQTIHKLYSTDAVVQWLEVLRDGVHAGLLESTQSHTQRLVLQIKSYIDNNVGEKLTLSTVADEFNISASYLSSLFQKHSSGFVEYVTEARIQAAKPLLLQGELLVSQIAETVGFDNIHYFSRVFKKKEGIPPSEYAQKNRE